MPINCFYFCVFAILLYSIPNNTFLKTARFELVLLLNKPSQNKFKRYLNNSTPINAQITGLTTLQPPLTTFRTPFMWSWSRSALIRLYNVVNGFRNVLKAVRDVVNGVIK